MPHGNDVHLLDSTVTEEERVADERPGGYGSKWRENWWKYLLVYLAIGAIAYAIIFYVFFRGNGYGG